VNAACGGTVLSCATGRADSRPDRRAPSLGKGRSRPPRGSRDAGAVTGGAEVALVNKTLLASGPAEARLSRPPAVARPAPPRQPDGRSRPGQGVARGARRVAWRRRPGGDAESSTLLAGRDAAP
jgi:hypothetical protein